MVFLYNIIGYTNILKALLEKDADLTLKNNKGLTAIEMAKDREIIKTFWKSLTGIGDSVAVDKKSKPKCTASFIKQSICNNKKRCKSFNVI